MPATRDLPPTTSPTTAPRTTAPRTTAPRAATTRRRGRRAGQVLSGLAVAFLLVDAVSHLLRPGVVVEATDALGFAPEAALVMGAVQLVCVVLYVVPRTAPLGAVLLTGYLGGAVAAQLRIEAPLVSTLLFPVYLGVVVWAGLWLRDARVRALLAGGQRP